MGAVALVSSAEAVADSQIGVRRNAAQDLHSLAKNAVVSILNAVETPTPRPAEVRGLVRNTLVQLEEVRRSWLRPELIEGQRPLQELWEAAMAILPPAWRLRCSLAESAGALKLQSTDQQLVRRLLSDLVVNAVAADAQHVEVQIRRTVIARTVWIDLSVADDGPGLPPGVLDDPMTSLAVIQGN